MPLVLNLRGAARMSLRSPARKARLKNWMMPFARSAAVRRSCRAMSRIMTPLDRLGAAIHERWGKLDIFIGNAGTHGVISPLGHIDPKEWDKAFAINVTANWRLIRSLDPLLRASDAGRVVLVSSGAAHRADLRPYWGLYSATKSAVDTIARTYAAETANVSPVRVMATNPGPLRTHMRAAVMPGEDPDTLRTPADFAPKLIDLCEPSWTQTGQLYDFPQDKVLSFRAPGLIRLAYRISATQLLPRDRQCACLTLRWKAQSAAAYSVV